MSISVLAALAALVPHTTENGWALTWRVWDIHTFVDFDDSSMNLSPKIMIDRQNVHSCVESSC